CQSPATRRRSVQVLPETLARRPPTVIDDQVQAVQPAPEDECPPGAMPQAAEQHGDEQVEVAPCRTLAIAAKRNVEVVAQEARQRHPPGSAHRFAPPETAASSPCGAEWGRRSGAENR